MKKLVAIILALAAVASACAPGDDRWCVDTELTASSFKRIFYGGPEEEMRSLLKDPCEGTRVGEFVETHFFSNGYSYYILECPETGIRMTIYDDGVNLVNTRTNEGIGTITGQKAVRAYRLMKKVTKSIESKAGEYAWEP